MAVIDQYAVFEYVASDKALDAHFGSYQVGYFNGLNLNHIP